MKALKSINYWVLVVLASIILVAVLPQFFRTIPQDILISIVKIMPLLLGAPSVILVVISFLQNVFLSSNDSKNIDAAESNMKTIKICTSFCLISGGLGIVIRSLGEEIFIQDFLGQYALILLAVLVIAVFSCMIAKIVIIISFFIEKGA